jgi:glycosyltransferase 2 family protein
MLRNTNALRLKPPSLLVALGILAGALSFIPGGLGATEAAIALLLIQVGVSTPDALIASLICRGLTLWLAVGIGLVAMASLSLLNPRQR